MQSGWLVPCGSNPQATTPVQQEYLLYGFACRWILAYVDIKDVTCGILDLLSDSLHG